MGIDYKDYYKILDVERSASADDIQKAYKKLVRLCCKEGGVSSHSLFIHGEQVETFEPYFRTYMTIFIFHLNYYTLIFKKQPPNDII